MPIRVEVEQEHLLEDKEFLETITQAIDNIFSATGTEKNNPEIVLHLYEEGTGPYPYISLDYVDATCTETSLSATARVTFYSVPYERLNITLTIGYVAGQILWYLTDIVWLEGALDTFLKLVELRRSVDVASLLRNNYCTALAIVYTGILPVTDYVIGRESEELEEEEVMYRIELEKDKPETALLATVLYLMTQPISPRQVMYMRDISEKVGELISKAFLEGILGVPHTRVDRAIRAVSDMLKQRLLEQPRDKYSAVEICRGIVSTLYQVGTQVETAKNILRATNRLYWYIKV